MGHRGWLCCPCGWSYSHCRQSAVSPWVAIVPPSSHSRATPAQPPSPVRRCHHPTGAGVPMLPLCPPSHTTASGMGHPPALCPCPHGCPLPAWPQRPKKSDFWRLFFVLCHNARLPPGAAGEQGGLCPPTSPTAPSPLAGRGSPLPHPPGRGLGPLHLPVPAGPPPSLPPRR